MTDKPTKLGKYTLTEQLGSGGFGTVFKATDPSGRTVAVKVLKPGWSDDPATIERFRREAQVAGELFHSRIATIIDFDEADGRLFLVMRYIDGIPLDKLIKQKGRIEWAQAIQILEQVAEGLDYAHQRGLVHRDIKPANILISEKDGAVITDFGLVKAADVSGMSTSGVMLGTPQYIAPEIWEGKPATPATDIYSLACVAYEMLTGQVLFAGVSPPDIMNKHMQPMPPLPEKSPTGLPAGLRTVITQALHRDLSKRYANVQTFLADLKKQETSLKQNLVVKAQGLAREADGLIQRNQLTAAKEKLAQVAELDPDSPMIANLEKKIEGMTRLNGVYAEVIEHYQAAYEKARMILSENPAYPDARGVFPRLGLRGGKPIPVAQPKQESASHPPVTSTDLRWQEKSMPYLLIALGLASATALGIGLIGLAAGIGLLWRKNWARKAGMVFAGVSEFASFGWIYFTLGYVEIEAAVYAPICLLTLPMAFFLIDTLGGPRMSAWTGAAAPNRPTKIWQIAIAYGSTILGIIPAAIMFWRKPAARIVAQGYAGFLLFVFPMLACITSVIALNSSGDGVFTTLITVIMGIFLVVLTVLAFRHLRSPEIRAYYENREP